MDKPLTLQIEETKKAIVNTINNSNLHLFVLDAILKDIYNELHILYKNRLLKRKWNTKNCKSTKNLPFNLKVLFYGGEN